jgi:hypothetical protein
MFHRTAVSSHMVPLAAPVTAQCLFPRRSLPLRLATRAVKCVGATPECTSIQCPLDGSQVLLRTLTTMAFVQVLPQPNATKPCHGRLSLGVLESDTQCDQMVVGVRKGAVFVRSSAHMEMELDVQQDDVFAIIAHLTPSQVDVAIESLLCSLSRSADVEEATEQLLLDSSAQRGIAVVVALGSSSSAIAQPPEQFP